MIWNSSPILDVEVDYGGLGVMQLQLALPK